MLLVKHWPAWDKNSNFFSTDAGSNSWKVTKYLHNKLGSIGGIVVRSRNRHCSGNATMLSVHNVELHVTVNNIKIFSVAQRYFRMNLCRRQQFNKKCENFCTIPNKFAGLPLISLIVTVQRKPRWYMWTDGHNETKGRLSQLCEHAWRVEKWCATPVFKHLVTKGMTGWYTAHSWSKVYSCAKTTLPVK